MDFRGVLGGLLCAWARSRSKCAALLLRLAVILMYGQFEVRMAIVLGHFSEYNDNNGVGYLWGGAQSTCTCTDEQSCLYLQPGMTSASHGDLDTTALNLWTGVEAPPKPEEVGWYPS